MNVFKTGTKVNITEMGYEGTILNARIISETVEYEVLYYNKDKKVYETVILPEKLVKSTDNIIRKKIGFK